MNTIYDGSFVLGDTNNLTFEAGPGITIDSPSAGTVRIGNDETVLWSGTRFTTGYRDLNESFLNFEQIRFKLCTEDQDNWQYKLYPCQTTAQYFNASISQIWPGITTATWTKTALWKPSSETRISGVAQTLQRITTGGIGNNITTTGGWVGIYEIVGINRISGSNA